MYPYHTHARPNQPHRPLIVAHRGFSAKAPENTMAGFRLALDAGADGLEFDVQLTKDGIPVVIHDETLERTTGKKGYVKDLTLKELQKLSAGSTFSSAFKKEEIPTLEQLFTELGSEFRLLNLELKTGMFPYPFIEEKVITLIRKYRLERRILISSFNHHSLQRIKMLAPDLPIGVLYMEGLVEPWLYARRLYAAALHPFYPNVTHEYVIVAHRFGLGVNPFTVNDDETMKTLIDAKVDSIITNHPDRLKKLL